MAWCYSTRPSVATVLRMHPCITSCLWVNWSPPPPSAASHICIDKLGHQHQAITRTNANLLSNGPVGTNFSEIWIEILIFSFKKMYMWKYSLWNGSHFVQGRWVKITHRERSMGMEHLNLWEWNFWIVGWKIWRNFANLKPSVFIISTFKPAFFLFE